ncbi:nucleotidyl transferase AbiEii/AbiGii toxin family protein [Dysgonomonas sp. GY75]|uniref:nucleotidyl transferase AbiEii/AbiGii toxin family protein n=1 Tax=Dysgonomonas sp. GY75 TaxID=2780419 RepID=UPI0018838626|nr:nucleotidyl transferase AbiEii/AbiGii toxin family protein [Dysgonomonas sp. GY75]MBF0649258.1 nucleotidyl transferase AbiEii/AbiGii toxin family protein [Dysgonomonas sp. GY75]
MLYYNTITPLLLTSLNKLMPACILKPFRLVGGTALSLQFGHRESVDIDLFTDSEYGSIDFDAIKDYLDREFSYVSTSEIDLIGFGKSYYIGESASDYIKLDLYYTDPFIRPVKEIDNIRLADVEDIIAMKLDVFSRNGRKKDFWDLHELLNRYSIDRMLSFYTERYPYAENEKDVINNLTQFDFAENDPDPVCLKGKYWDLIKLDFVEAVNTK